jgi:hypothetical protein
VKPFFRRKPGFGMAEIFDAFRFLATVLVGVAVVGGLASRQLYYPSKNAERPGAISAHSAPESVSNDPS